MPRCVFKLLWDVIQGEKEIFAYVNNMGKNGDNYWVFTHVTPSYNLNGEMIGYHSNRRVPKQSVVSVVKPVYQELCRIERGFPDPKAGMAASTNALLETITGGGFSSYDEFIFALTNASDEKATEKR